MTLNAKVVAPVVVFAVALVLTGVMVSSRPAAESQRPRTVAPPVTIYRVAAGDAQLRVTAQGIVEPRTESDLVTEVAGRLVWVSPNFAPGGFFGEGEALARIDPRDYHVALEGARAALARARANLTHAAAGLKRQQSMRQSGASSRALLDDAIHAQATAEAGVREAKVAVRRAELDLERTQVRAPFAGRVRDKRVDVGQFVARGVAVARVYATDYVEIRLPVHGADLGYLDLPARFRAEVEPAEGELGPAVLVSAQVAGRSFEWTGRIVRVEGALDPRTRMTHIVARVDDPYEREEGSDRPPLPIGLFVEVSIEGRVERGVFEIPRRSLRHGNELLVVDSESRLRVRRVDVLRSDRDHSWIRSGIAEGERIVTSSLDVVTEGMPVRVMEAPQPEAAASEARS
jgi:multidrug efflux system membrane fusion protein